MERLGIEQGEAADDIGQQALDGQGNGQSQDAGQGDDAGDIDAQLGSHGQAQQQVQGNLYQRFDEAVGRLLQLGLIQEFLDNGHDRSDNQSTDGQQNDSGQQLAHYKSPAHDKPLMQLNHKCRIHMYLSLRKFRYSHYTETSPPFQVKLC